MLNILRKKAQSIVIQAVVLIIAIVFIFWGVGTNIGGKRNMLATVNGVEIPYQDYQRNYDNAVENLRVQFGGSIPQGLLEGLDLNRQVLNQLIQAEILRQGGRKMGITVSKLATQEEIMDMEVFQTDGQFDLARYREILSQNRMTPTVFEAGLQNDLLASRVTEAIRSFALVTDNQVETVAAYVGEEVKLAYAALRGEDVADRVRIEEAELAAWYDERKNDYLSEPKIRLQYLFFSYDDDLGQLTVDDEAVRAYYEENIDTYSVPERRRARHILLRVSEVDDAGVRTARKKKAEEILELAREGDDFAELARQYSEDPSAANGGDLGFFSRGAMVEPFDDAVFRMQPGDISEVVETVFGFHIIKLEEVSRAGVRSLDEVRDEIADRLKQKEVRGATFKRASQAYEDIIRAGSLANYTAGGEGEPVAQTDYFSRNDPPGPPVSDPRFLQGAFRLKKGELSSLVETGGGYAILFVDDVQEPQVPELEAVREQVEADFRRARSLELAREEAEKLLNEARDKKSLAAALPAEIEIKESGYIRHADPASAGEVPAQVVQEAFELPGGEKLPQQPAAVGDAFYLYELVEKRQGDRSMDESERAMLREQLLTSVENELMTGWLTFMESKADIWVNEQLLR
ncbi:MAG TPA: hypothetical protein ENN06_04725 [Desulfobacteraceae bacterium]|nr:hypothetical protein [Desulfobacteraceae bacterium]